MTASVSIHDNDKHLTKSRARPHTLGKSWRGLISFLVLLIVWWAAARFGPWPEAMFPGPVEVIRAFGEVAYKGVLPAHIVYSSINLFLGAAVGVGIGAVVGLLIGTSRTLARTFNPLIKFFQAITEIAWLPLLVLVMGFSTVSIIVVIAYTVSFPVMTNSALGVRQIPPRMVEAVFTLGGNRWNSFVDVAIPGSLPSLITGIRMGIGYGWRALIASEMIVGGAGLGFMIFDARSGMQVDRIIVGMIVIGILWLATDRLILRPIEKVTIERWALIDRGGRG